MHRTPRFLPEGGLGDLISAVPGVGCFVSSEKPSGTDYVNSRSAVPSLRSRRPTSPVKSFFFPAREKVAVYWGAGELPQVEPFSVIGIRNCDLESLRYLDQVFLGGVCEDPLYRARRSAAFLVSVDCAPPQPSCFCTAVGVNPYAERGFDLNLTPAHDGYVVVSGSEAGDAVLERIAGQLGDVTEAHSREAVERRSVMVDELRHACGTQGNLSALGERMAGTEVHQVWEPWAGKCVECGACTAVCPTCHCYYLLDTPDARPQASPGAYAKERTWDSCLLAEYARMAGAGAKLSPRPRLRSRLSNRVLHKYVYSPVQYGMCGCLGCGRCDEACLGAISIREMVASVGTAV